MGLRAGTQLGPYEITEPLGSGGMGDVYRARDTRLGRDVAIKVLPDVLARHGTALARFEQEARALAALNHPNLLAIFDVGSAEGVNYFVSELLEGKTLRQLLSEGALPRRKLADYSVRIAEGLAAAHEKGIVHRDLKPENVFITKDDRVKILDFGLAKYVADATNEGTTLLHARPGTTEPGVVMGTVGYMSPEQVCGEAADSRSDIFSFGAMLFEAAYGRRAFKRDTAAETMNAILSGEPPEILAGDAGLPPGLESILRHCLEKKPSERFQSARDLAFALSSLSGISLILPARRTEKRGFRAGWKWAAVSIAIAAIALVIGRWSTGSVTSAPEVRTVLQPQTGVAVLMVGDDGGAPALSPDGSRFVFRGTTSGQRMLFLRSMASAAATPIPGTEDGHFPFWSPDGKSIGFFADKQLKRLEIAAGPPVSLARADYPRGGAWAGNTILYAPYLYDTIWRVPAGGGVAARVTKLDPALHTTHRWPQFLSDGKHFVYLAQNHLGGKREAGGIYGASLDGGAPKFIVRTEGSAIYSSGYLLYYQDGSLLAQQLDEKTMALKGNATVLGQVLRDTGDFEMFATASRNGMLLFQSAGEVKYPVQWFDARGQNQGAAPFWGPLKTLRLSPDGTRAAVVGFEGPAGTLNIINLKGGTVTKLSFGENAWYVVWSPNGREVIYSSQKPGSENTEIYRKPADGSSERQVVLSEDQIDHPTDWTGDGRFLVFNRGRSGSREIWLLPLTGEHKPVPLFPDSKYDYSDGRVSPDGNWVAYVTSEFSNTDLFVTSFPAGHGKWQISPPGGVQPPAVWSADGKELYFISKAGEVMEARLESSSGTIKVQSLQRLFPTPFHATALYSLFDVDSHNGSRFLGSVSPDVSSLPLNVVTNWAPQLQKRENPE